MSSLNYAIIFFVIFFKAQAFSQSIIINEVSQGTSGNQEYVEFLVTGPALLNCNDVPPCLDLRLWVFDDNNGYLNGGATAGVGIAPGAVRFADNPFWSCIPVGTIIVIYNNGDTNPDVPVPDTDMNDGNCTLSIPISSTLFERHPTLPSSSDSNYSGTGWVSGGSWMPITMANTQDGFQIYNPSNLTVPVFSIGWGADNDLGDIDMGSGAATGDVFYATDCNYLYQASWVQGAASTAQTPGSPNNVAQADCIGQTNANCNPPIVTITSTPATCGNCDGTATATIIGGTSPFQLTWTPAPAAGQGTTSISGLCAGSYELLLVDDNGTGCSLLTPVTISASGDPFPPTASNPFSVTVQCIVDVPAPNPAVVIDAVDNGAPPVVTWEDDTSDGNSCPQEITRIYRVTDDCGNFIFVEQTITVTDDIPPTASTPAPLSVECITDVPPTNAAVVIDEADNCGVPTVAFVSESSDGNECAGEIIIRTYSVTDSCGNSITVTHTITVDSYTPFFTVAGTDPTVCGGTDGFITISGLLSDTEYSFEYGGNTAITITTNGSGDYVIIGLGAGSYSGFTVSDADCPACSTTNGATITLTDPTPPTVDAGIDQTVCEGSTVILTATNPDGAIITWNNGVEDGASFTPAVGTTTYTVTANLAGCINTDQVNVTVTPLPTIDAGFDQAVCDGASVILTATNPDGAVITWDNGITNGVSFIPDQTTTYTVTGNSLGCTATDQVQVTVNPLSEVSFTGDNLSGCIPLTTVLTNNSSITGNSCVWDISNGQTLFGCNSVSLITTDPGCYDVTLTVTTSAGCESQATVLNYICTEGPPNANFSADPMVVTSNDPIVNFTNGSSGAVNYEWDFGDGNTSNEINPSHQYESTEEGLYTVQLIALSQYGCSDTAYAIIEVQEDLIFYVPNTFTPDNDNYNETFQPVFTSGFDPYDFNLLIFNRWGEILFESNNANIGWDGTYGGKIVKDGTYIWKIEFKTKYTDERQVHVGHVNILR